MTAISWWRTGLGEEEIARLQRAIVEEKLGDGPITAEFEAAFARRLGVPHAIAVPSGSMALLLALLALDIGSGDEVIVPDSTWIATAHAASLLGAHVVLTDTRSDRPLLDVEEVARCITSRTRAILPVHLGGRAVEMAALQELAAHHRILVVEDACQAVLSRTANGYLGTLGDIGCYSLGVAKLLTTGQGGLVVTRDSDLYAKLRRAKLHGVAATGEWEVYERLGYNFKFTDLMAAIGLEQLNRADQRITHVAAIYRRYAEGLANLPHVRVSPVDLNSGEIPLWTEVETPHVPALVTYLAGLGIQTRRVHPPLHRAPHLANAGDFPHATRFCRELLVLPSGPTQLLENVDATIKAIQAWRP